MRKIFKYGIFVILFFLVGVFGINFFVKKSTSKLIVEKKSKKLKNTDCALVLGAGVWNNIPSPILKDRLDVAVDLYKKGIVPKIIMSGDHSTNTYDEVNVMKKYAIDSGVASSDIFMDHAGVSTYDSMYRAKNIFNVKKMIIVTQEYHLYRSLYIARSLKIESYGIKADSRKYSDELKNEVREILARDKDFFKSIFKPKSKSMGEVTPVNGNGDITND